MFYKFTEQKLTLTIEKIGHLSTDQLKEELSFAKVLWKSWARLT